MRISRRFPEDKIPLTPFDLEDAERSISQTRTQERDISDDHLEYRSLPSSGNQRDQSKEVGENRGQKSISGILRNSKATHPNRETDKFSSSQNPFSPSTSPSLPYPGGNYSTTPSQPSLPSTPFYQTPSTHSGTATNLGTHYYLNQSQASIDQTYSDRSVYLESGGGRRAENRSGSKGYAGAAELM